MDASGQGVERTSLVLFGSETGNAQDFAEEIGRLTERLRFSTRVTDLDNVSPYDLAKRKGVVFFVVSTTGQGELPLNARKFWKTLLKRSLPAGLLSNTRYSIFGLGDSSYPHFNYAARKLRARLRQLGAVEIYQAGEADDQHEDSTEGNFLSWFLPLRDALLGSYPLPAGLEPISDDTSWQRKWTLSPSDQSVVRERDDDTVSVQDRINSDEDHFSVDPRLIPGAHSMKVQAIKRITPERHWQDVRLLTLTTTDPIDYVPGDVLAISPRNMKEDVDNLISWQEWSHIADEPISIVPHGEVARHDLNHYPPSPIPQLPKSPATTLHTLLTDYVDITAIPRRSFFARLLQFAEIDDSETGNAQRERLREFTNPELVDELWDYTTRPRRSIIEVLQEFTKVHIPWDRVLDVFPLLKPRQFSIASGGVLKQIPGGGTKFELLIAIVKYQTVIRRIRRGVCTRYIAALQPGFEMKVVFQKGGLQWTEADAFKPCILIGGGTGIAPLRSILREKNMIADAEAGASMLVFGCREEKADYFFKDELKDPEAVGRSVEVHTAFSRDQKEKVYIQNVIPRIWDKIFELLYTKKATVYVCGSSGKMPQAVRRALRDCLVLGATKYVDGITDAKTANGWADRFLAIMEGQRRYKQETW